MMPTPFSPVVDFHKVPNMSRDMFIEKEHYFQWAGWFRK
jgi:hypothetical protein